MSNILYIVFWLLLTCPCGLQFKPYSNIRIPEVSVIRQHIQYAKYWYIFKLKMTEQAFFSLKIIFFFVSDKSQNVFNGEMR